jgi:hypothetical protein
LPAFIIIFICSKPIIFIFVKVLKWFVTVVSRGIQIMVVSCTLVSLPRTGWRWTLINGGWRVKSKLWQCGSIMIQYPVLR